MSHDFLTEEAVDKEIDQQAAQKLNKRERRGKAVARLQEEILLDERKKRPSDRSHTRSFVS
jgi:hypothetical protein